MAVLTGTTSHQPSALLNTGQGTVSPESSRLPFLQVLTDRQLRHSLTHSRLVQAIRVLPPDPAPPHDRRVMGVATPRRAPGSRSA
jgi:hypothetical protein